MSTLTASPAPEGVMTSGAAVGIRIHTLGGVDPRWVRDTVLPLWEEATGGGRRLVSLHRGWVGGPHVELTAVGPDADHLDWAGLAAAADAGPEPVDALTPAAYLDRARTRGRLENVAPPHLPLHPHGAVRRVPRREALRADHPLDGLRAVVGGTLAPAVVRGIREVADEPATRITHLIDVLAQIANAHTMGAGYGTFSLRSHVEALLPWMSPGGELRTAFEQRYAQHHDAVVTRVGDVLDGRAGLHAADWGRVIAYSRGVIDETVRRGELDDRVVDALGHRLATVPGEGTPPTTDAEASGPTAAADHPDTDFHKAV